jgi:hypothetical protein
MNLLRTLFKAKTPFKRHSDSVQTWAKIEYGGDWNFIYQHIVNNSVPVEYRRKDK